MALNGEDFRGLEKHDEIMGIGSMFGGMVTDRKGEVVTIQTIGDLEGNNPSCDCVWSEEKQCVTDQDGLTDNPIIMELNSSGHTLKQEGEALADEWLRAGIINLTQHGRLINAVRTTWVKAQATGLSL